MNYIFLFSILFYVSAYHEIVMVLRDIMSTHAMVGTSIHTNSVTKWV